MPSDTRGLRLRLVLLTFGIYVPLALAFTLFTNAHDYFLHVRRFAALPILTEQFAFPVMGAGPRGHDDLNASHSLLFYAFWLPLAFGPIVLSFAIARGTERVHIIERALQGIVAYFLMTSAFFVLLIIGIVAPFF